MKPEAMRRPSVRKTTVTAAADIAPRPAAPSQIGRRRGCSAEPTAALTRIPTAIESPSGNMNVRAAQEIAIWWAARARAPSQPIMTVAAEKAPPSKRRPPAAGSPIPSIRRNLPAEMGASQRRGQEGRIAGSIRSQAKIAAEVRSREARVATPEPVSPSSGAPQCP
jgi:hypothetical protein